MRGLYLNLEVQLRQATADDIPAMMALEEHAVTASHWSHEQYGRLFSENVPKRVAFVIEESNAIQGFLVGRAVERDWEIENIAVAGLARRRGLGSRLIGEFLDLARERGAESVFLEVRESNRAARALYEKWAFVEAGRRNGYYRDPQEDAVTYRLLFA